MPVGDLVQELAELWSIDQVAIVGKADAIGAVDIERLSLSTGAWSCAALVTTQ